MTRRTAPRWTTDHPRSRGVYGTQGAGYMLRFGSSPLARGLPAFRLERRHELGIIPARAGFTDRTGLRIERD